MLSVEWFLCIFCTTLPVHTAMRLWDVMFLQGETAAAHSPRRSDVVSICTGPTATFRVALAILDASSGAHECACRSVGRCIMRAAAETLTRVANSPDGPRGAGFNCVKCARACVERRSARTCSGAQRSHHGTRGAQPGCVVEGAIAPQDGSRSAHDATFSPHVVGRAQVAYSWGRGLSARRFSHDGLFRLRCGAAEHSGRGGDTAWCLMPSYR